MSTKEEQRSEGGKRKPVLVRKLVLVAKSQPSSKDKLPDVKTQTFNQVETTTNNQSYSRENAILSQLSHLRKLEFQETGERETLLEDYSNVLAEEADLLKRISDLQPRKKNMESCLRHLQRGLTNLRFQIQDKEIELKEAHKEIEDSRQILITAFEKTCGELQRVKVEHERDCTLLASEAAKRIRLKIDLDRLEKDLESEKDKTTCQICMKSTRDTIILPCMHYLYCKDCLISHQMKNSTCPTCRGPIKALLPCELGLE